MGHDWLVLIISIMIKLLEYVEIEQTVAMTYEHTEKHASSDLPDNCLILSL